MLDTAAQFHATHTRGPFGSRAESKPKLKFQWCIGSELLLQFLLWTDGGKGFFADKKIISRIHNNRALFFDRVLCSLCSVASFLTVRKDDNNLVISRYIIYFLG